MPFDVVSYLLARRAIAAARLKPTYALTSIDDLASAIASNPSNDYLATLFQNQFALDLCAAIMDSAGLGGAKAGAILSNPSLSASKTIDILKSMRTMYKLVGNVLWSDGVSTAWPVTELYDPDGNASGSTSVVTSPLFRDAPRSLSVTMTDGGGTYAAVEYAYKSLSLSVRGLRKLVIFFGIYSSARSSTYGNFKVIIKYTDTGGAARTVQYIIWKGSSWSDAITTDISFDLSGSYALGSWGVFARNFIADTASYPPSTITEIGFRMGEYNATLTMYISPIIILGG